MFKGKNIREYEKITESDLSASQRKFHRGIRTKTEGKKIITPVAPITNATQKNFNKKLNVASESEETKIRHMTSETT